MKLSRFSVLEETSSPPPDVDAVYAAVHGRAPKLEVRLVGSSPRDVEVSDIQQLILQLLGFGLPPKWAQTLHTSLLRKVVVVLAGGLGREMFAPETGAVSVAALALLPTLSGAKRVPIRSPFKGPKVIYPLSRLLMLSHKTPGMRNEMMALRKQQQRHQQQAGSKRATTDSSPAKFSASPASSSVVESVELQRLYELVHDEAMLIEHGYPLQGHAHPEYAYDGFVEMDEWDESRWQAFPEHLKVLAVDCEMCLTASGSELTRVSVVDLLGNLVFDSLVLPHGTVLDYKTPYSGITAEMLASVQTRLEDVHQRFRELMCGTRTVLCGHSLENDLKALKLFHRRCLDTALLYPRQPGGPQRYSKLPLKSLALKFLQRDMRAGQSQGHCSIEDSAVAMQLIVLKARMGEHFGVPSHEFAPLFSLFDLKGIKASMAACPEALRRWCQGSGVSAVPCHTDDDVVTATASLAAEQSSAKFVLGQIERFSKLSGPASSEDLEWLNLALHQILRSVADRSVVLLITAPENLTALSELNQLKTSAQWDSKCESQLLKVFEQSRQGFAFIWTT